LPPRSKVWLLMSANLSEKLPDRRHNRGAGLEAPIADVQLQRGRVHPVWRQLPESLGGVAVLGGEVRGARPLVWAELIDRAAQPRLDRGAPPASPPRHLPVAALPLVSESSGRTCSRDRALTSWETVSFDSGHSLLIFGKWQCRFLELARFQIPGWFGGRDDRERSRVEPGLGFISGTQSAQSRLTHTTSPLF